MKGRNPTKDEQTRMRKIADLGCIVCRLFYSCYSPAAIHHIDGKTKPNAHFKTIPLCGAHHQTGGYGVALHAGKRAFAKKYANEDYLLAETNRLIL